MTKQQAGPQPMAFAILRNTHEVLRSSISLMDELVDKGAMDDLRKEFGNFRRCRSTHAAMEDGAVFELLDEVSGGAITEAGLALEHEEDEKNAGWVEQAETADELTRAFQTWKAHQLDHMAHEERVMGPLTMKTAPTPEGRGLVVHERLVAPAIEHGDFDWYLAFVIARLTEYGTQGQPPNIAVRVFAWGLQHAASPEQWSSWKNIIQENTSAEIWDEMVTQFQIDAGGKITA
jgi:hypothetical protein